MEITSILATYGALLSTFIFFWNIRNSQSRIKVALIQGACGEGDGFEMGFYVSIKNPSLHPVHITAVSLVYPYRHITLIDKIGFYIKRGKLYPFVAWVHDSIIFKKIETGLPKSIEPGNSHNIFIPESALKETLKNTPSTVIAACVQDALWRNKYSAAVRCNIT